MSWYDPSPDMIMLDQSREHRFRVILPTGLQWPPPAFLHGLEHHAGSRFMSAGGDYGTWRRNIEE